MTLMPEILITMNKWSSIQLSHDIQLQYAKDAIKLKWPNESPFENLFHFLAAKREADSGNNLWTFFNLVQEKLIRGGVPYMTNKGYKTSTYVRSIDKNSELNKDLWNLTKQYEQRLTQ